jgi:hypothetical protein
LCRWGEIVFASVDSNVGWDETCGTETEKKVSQGRLYTWKIQYKLLYKDAAAYVKG